MPPERPKPIIGGGAVLGAVLGALAAVAVSVAIAGMDPQGGGFGGAVDSAFRTTWTQFPLAWVPLAGAFFGFLAGGGFAGSQLAVTILRGILTGFKLFLGASLGAGVAVAAYVALWIAGNPEASVGRGVLQPGFGLRTPGDPIFAFLGAGALTGFAITLFVVGGSAIRTWTRAMSSVVVGSVAGLVVFTIGYVVVNYPTVPDSSEYLFHFAEAIYSFSPVELLFVGIGATVGFLMSKYSWRLYGILTLIALISVVLGYISYTVTQTLPFLSPASKPLSYGLFVAETLSLSMVVLYSFYSIDVATRKHWRRTPQDSEFSPYYLPKVCLQVPVYNEPPEIAIPTLKTLVSLDYPVDRYMIMVLDDSTRPECRQALEQFCEQHQKDAQIVYYHRETRAGYKAGALNYGLERTPDDVNVIGIIDADYQVEPEYLRETVGYFIDAGLGWLQSPQDYRNRHESFLTEQYYLADAYFYRAILPSRNEENSIIFCGTMGLLRRQALAEVGGWGEKFITEDAELSLRLVKNGWRSLYVNKTFGRGLIPATFDAYKKQHYRWAFGGGRILRGHFWDFLFARMTTRQRFDYFVGNINWFEGAFVLAIAGAVLLMGIGEVLGLGLATHHSNEIFLIGLIPWFLLIDGLSRVHMVLRRTMAMSFLASLRVMGMWMTVKFSDMFAAMKALLGFSIPFVRTSKARPVQVRGLAGWKQAVSLTRFESTMAALLVLTAIGLALKMWAFSDAVAGPTLVRSFLLLWLLWYSLVFLAAPLYAYRSYASLRPQAESLPAPTNPTGVPT